MTKTPEDLRREAVEKEFRGAFGGVPLISVEEASRTPEEMERDILERIAEWESRAVPQTRYAVTFCEVGAPRVVVSVHRTAEAARRAWERCSREDPEGSWGCSIAPGHKRPGSVLTLAEIMSACSADPSATL